MGQPQKHFIIVAGEASGDVHAAHLVDELKKLDPSLTFSGVGGPRLQASGVELYKDISSLAVVGFVEVLKNYGKIRRIFNLILKKSIRSTLKRSSLSIIPDLIYDWPKKSKSAMSRSSIISVPRSGHGKPTASNKSRNMWTKCWSCSALSRIFTPGATSGWILSGIL